MIFSRNRGSGRHAKSGPEGREALDRDLDGDLDAFEDDGEPRAGKSDRADGPYDISEAPEGIAQLDLGALKVPAVENVEVRVQADNDGKIQQIVLVFEESALQLGVFAAPRSEGIWDEVRAEIRKQLFNDGVAAEEVQGDYGTELRARVRTPDGLTDIRFVGVDGPRWLVRAVFQGPAAVDPQAAPPLLECLRNLVVERGNEAMPVREPLSLHLPKEVTEGGAEASGADPATPAAGSAAADGGDGSASGRRRPSPRPRRK
ncbi:DUF3710 domain-containing protein [Dactylosporangium vinaceum]|uniref:DUF3710 domain-containing protein n=1 Tax=Dactylosporangium vinaceum TaxID=53362 RepID=A0ABV5LYM5_9ACTN|nr:DUF3710 domain-containing protein [Dactylosporangium vinaceum]UAB98242.1 DUF3710 domain-containing protein [Dactylosporangium vinaceum]